MDFQRLEAAARCRGGSGCRGGSKSASGCGSLRRKGQEKCRQREGKKGAADKQQRRGAVGAGHPPPCFKPPAGNLAPFVEELGSMGYKRRHPRGSGGRRI